MHAGKHQEYEKKLHEALLQRSNNNNTNSNQNVNTTTTTASTETKPTSKSKESVPSNGTNKENWPQLNSEKDIKEKKPEKTEKSKGKSKDKPKEKKEKKPEVKEMKKEECVEKLSLLNDNSSFFSHNSFQKIVPEPGTQDEDSPTEPILTDSLPDINTTEDWAAAFGFNKTETEFDFRNLIESSLSKNNGYSKPTLQPAPPSQENYFGKESGLDQHMSKFFMDFHQKHGQKDNTNGFTMANNHMNGFNHVNNYFLSNQDRLVLLQQKKIEEHLMNLSLKQTYGGQYMNGEVGQQNGYGYQGGTMYQSQQQQMKNRTHSEDDLGFDPFQETQKALAELIANEQSYKTHNNGKYFDI